MLPSGPKGHSDGCACCLPFCCWCFGGGFLLGGLPPRWEGEGSWRVVRKRKPASTPAEVWVR